MKLEDMLKQQKNRGMKQDKIKAKMQSYDEYVQDELSPRPYNTSNVSDYVPPIESQEPKTKKTNQERTSKGIIKFHSLKNEKPILKITYNSLSGNEKKIIDVIAYQCVLNNSNETIYLDKAVFSERTSVKVGAIKTTVRRLKEKGVLVSYTASKGRHSSWMFVISEVILNEYIQSSAK
jgi:hypothetical protein